MIRKKVIISYLILPGLLISISFAEDSSGTNFKPTAKAARKMCCIPKINYQVASNRFYTYGGPATVTTRWIMTKHDQTVDNSDYYNMHSSGFSGYDSDRTIYNCPPPLVAINVVGMQDGTMGESTRSNSLGSVGGVFCAKIEMDCAWIPYDQYSRSGSAPYVFYAPEPNDYWVDTTYSYSGYCT